MVRREKKLRKPRARRLANWMMPLMAATFAKPALNSLRSWSEAINHGWLLLPRVHCLHPLDQFSLGLGHARILSEILCPRVDPHLCPENAGVSDDFVDPVE